jgi:hypothetical protein
MAGCCGQVDPFSLFQRLLGQSSGLRTFEARIDRTRTALGVSVMVMRMMAMMMTGGSESRAGKNQDQQEGSKNLLHSPNLAWEDCGNGLQGATEPSEETGPTRNAPRPRGA